MKLDLMKMWRKVNLESPNKLYLVLKEDKAIIREVESEKIIKIIDLDSNK